MRPARGADRIGADRARDVHRIAQDVVRRGGAEEHLSAIGTDLSAIGHQRLAGAIDEIAKLVGRYSDRQEAVAGQIERNHLAGAETDLAEPRRNDAVIGDAATEQRCEAAVGHVDAAGIGDNSRGAVTGKLVFAR